MELTKGSTKDSLTEHIRKIRERNNKADKNRKQFAGDGANIWHGWESGEQQVRFVDDFLLTKTHYIGNKSRGRVPLLKIYPDSSFEGDDRISGVVNCANWDIEHEQEIDGGCVLCKLNQIARDALRSEGHEDMEEGVKKTFTNLKGRTNHRSAYRWNMIDRKNPNVSEGTFGYKITSVGQELFEQLMVNVHDKVSPRCFSDADEGIDVSVTKTGDSKSNERIKYSAGLVIEGESIAITPLTDEEKQAPRHSLKEICGKQADQQSLHDQLLDKWKGLLGAWEESQDAEEDSEVAAEAPAEAPAEEAPTKEEAPAEKAPAKEEAPAEKAPESEEESGEDLAAQVKKGKGEKAPF